MVLLSACSSGASRSEVEQGIGYIISQEGKDVSEIEKAILEQKLVPVSEDVEAEDYYERFEGMGIWEKLNSFNTYVAGDSRVETLLYSGLTDGHVKAEKSTTIKVLEEWAEEIGSWNAGVLVLSFGLNDMGMYAFDPDNYWETGEDYVEAYKYYIDLIREYSPDTKIMITSIMPVQDFAIETQERWAAVPQWNAAIKEFCASYGLGYVDADFITTDYADSFIDDGVHFYGQEVNDAWGEAIFEAIKEMRIEV